MCESAVTQTQSRIVLIHATRVAIDPIVAAFELHWPDAEPVPLLDESLAIDRRAQSDLTPELTQRISDLAHHANLIGATGILFTCSAFGEAIEEVEKNSRLPVLKPNEAMFDEALAYGERIAMIYTFPPAVTGMEKEFFQQASASGDQVNLSLHYAEGALEALQKGDEEAHNMAIVNQINTIGSVDAIMLAQFSMARAESLTQARTDVPVLSSPVSAVNKLKSMLVKSAGNSLC